MKVLLVHNYYQQRGGEDRVVAQEMELFQSKGVNVQLYSVHNDAINGRSIIGKARTAIETAWSYSEYKNIRKKLMDMKPDVVHVHNFFPLISPSIYYACSELGIPVVQTLHNYRLICPAATLMRDNRICEECVSGSLISSLKHGCYRDSKMQTLSVASMIKLNRILGTWSRKIDRYIVLTEFAKKKFIESGIPEHRISVKPNFVIRRHSDYPSQLKEADYILFVGRIAVEKGVRNLLDAYRLLKNRVSTKLVIIGDGPDRDMLAKEFGEDGVIFLGNQNSDTVLRYMEQARYLVVPSIWYEGFPMTIVESYSVGTPVLSSKIGALEEVVKDTVTGFHFPPYDVQLIAEVMERALRFDQYQELRQRVLHTYESLYTEDVNFEQTMNIYREVIEENEDAKAKVH